MSTESAQQIAEEHPPRSFTRGRVPVAPGPVRVLIVDDSLVDRELYVAMLAPSEGRSYEASGCGDPEEALARVATHLPDCVLLDFRLPRMDGLEFLRRISELDLPEPVPVVMLTGVEDETLPVRAKKAGALECLRKKALCAESLQRAVGYAADWRDAALSRRRERFETAHSVDPASRPERGDQCPGTDRPRVLVVDDEPGVLRAYQRVLRPSCNVQAAASAHEALELIERAAFDVVVCDVSMPIMDGSVLYERVRERHPELCDRFVFCSGGAVTEATRLFLEEHADRLLSKPVHPRELVEFVLRIGEAHRCAGERR